MLCQVNSNYIERAVTERVIHWLFGSLGQVWPVLVSLQVWAIKRFRLNILRDRDTEKWREERQEINVLFNRVPHLCGHSFWPLLTSTDTRVESETKKIYIFFSGVSNVAIFGLSMAGTERHSLERHILGTQACIAYPKAEQIFVFKARVQHRIHWKFFFRPIRL